jgi:phage terminase small subunit
MNKLLPKKQRLFVEAYLANPNATQSAIKAGYSEKTAYSQGQRLLKNVEIAKLLEKRVATAIITADEILNDVKTIAKSRCRESDRLKAYELLGKHLRMWTDRTELSGPDGGPLEIESVIRPKLQSDDGENE